MNPNQLTSYHLQANKGFSVVEVLLAVSVMALIITGFTGAIIYGQESTVVAASQARATFIAEEGLEAVRNIRDSGFANLTDGTFGLSTSSSQWSFNDSADVTDNFTRDINITSVDANRKQVVSTVTWQQTPSRTGNVALTTYLTHWKTTVPVTSCAVYCQTLGGYTTGTCRQNTQQCLNNSETYESGGNSICVTNFPGDPSHNTCCCAP